MSKFIFLKDVNSEGTVKYFAIDVEKIETLRESDTYGPYGQQVSPQDAGNSLTLLTQAAVDVANKAYHDYHAEYDDTEVLQHYSISDVILAYESSNDYDAIVESSLIENEDYSIESPYVKGFTYWDGSNYKTVVVEREFESNISHEIVKDEDLIEELNQAIEDKEYVKSEFGKEKYQSGNWEIVDNHCQGSWSSYEISEIEED